MCFNIAMVASRKRRSTSRPLVFSCSLWPDLPVLWSATHFLSQSLLKYRPLVIFTALDSEPALKNIKDVSRCCEIIKKHSNVSKKH